MAKNQDKFDFTIFMINCKYVYTNSFTSEDTNYGNVLVITLKSKGQLVVGCTRVIWMFKS